jgi:hypothetical protein
MRRIKLPELPYLQECFSYDPGTGSLVWRERPASHFSDVNHRSSVNTRFAGTEAGATLVNGYRTVRVRFRLYFAHRIIYKLMTGEDPPEQIDHKNLNPGDNRWDNLRPATEGNNHCNTVRRNRDLPKGVRRARRNGYVSYIKRDGVTKYLGQFTTPEAAHAAYCAAGERLHGEFFRAALP